MNTLRSHFRTFIRANFFAGVFVAVPFAISIGFLLWVWGKINEPLAKVFDVATGPGDTPWAQFVSGMESSSSSKLLIPLLGLIIVIISVLVLGIVARSIIGRMALSSVESAVSRLPLVGMLYNSVKQLGEAFLSSDGKSKFQRAVAVQFPCRGTWAIGFVTGKGENIFRHVDPLRNPAVPIPQQMLTVFVPTTPLPSNGFMIVVPECETMDLAMTVQDALKLVVSGGIIGAADGSPATGNGKPTRIMIATPVVREESKSM